MLHTIASAVWNASVNDWAYAIAGGCALVVFLGIGFWVISQAEDARK